MLNVSVPQVNSYVVGIREAVCKPSALPCQQLLIRHHTLCGVMRKLRARMADMAPHAIYAHGQS